MEIFAPRKGGGREMSRDCLASLYVEGRYKYFCVPLGIWLLWHNSLDDYLYTQNQGDVTK